MENEELETQLLQEEQQSPQELQNEQNETLADIEPLSDSGSQALLDALTDEETPNEPEASVIEDKIPSGQSVEPVGDEEVLNEIKSERGRTRVKEIIEEKKAIEAQIGELHQAFTTAGMSTEDFAKTLEFSRLATSQNLQENRLALEMLENVRADLCRKLGVSGQGFDILDDFPDLKRRVDEFELDRTDAEAVARSRLIEQQKQTLAQAQQEAQKQHQEYKHQLGQFQANAEAYFKTRESELDYPAKIARIQRYFSDTQKLQHFVATFGPHQWLPQLQIMYDNMTVSHPSSPTPIRSRPQNLGRQSIKNATPEDIIGNAMDQLGL